MNFIKTSFFSGIATFIDLISKLITNKLIAIYLGTSGMFLLGQLKDFVSLTKEISSLGINNGIVKYTSTYQKDHTSLKKYLSTGFKVYFICSTIVMASIILLRKELSLYLFNSLDYSTYLIILSLSIVSVSIYTFFMCILNGIRNIKIFNKYSINHYICTNTHSFNHKI